MYLVGSSFCSCFASDKAFVWKISTMAVVCQLVCNAVSIVVRIKLILGIYFKCCFICGLCCCNICFPVWSFCVLVCTIFKFLGNFQRWKLFNRTKAYRNFISVFCFDGHFSGILFINAIIVCSCSVLSKICPGKAFGNFYFVGFTFLEVSFFWRISPVVCFIIKSRVRNRVSTYNCGIQFRISNSCIAVCKNRTSLGICLFRVSASQYFAICT